MPGALAKLARLRRLEAEAAKRDLAAALAAERAAQDRLAQAREAVAQEAKIEVPATPGAFAAWLPEAAQAIARCISAEAQAALQATAARDALAQRLAARKAIDTVLADRTEAQRIEAARRLERAREARPRNN